VGDAFVQLMLTVQELFSPYPCRQLLEAPNTKINVLLSSRSLTGGQAQLLGLTRGSSGTSTLQQQGNSISGGGNSGGSPRSNPVTATPPLEPRSFTRSSGGSKQGASSILYSPRNSQPSHGCKLFM
jgi:hypothetical protein